MTSRAQLLEVLDRLVVPFEQSDERAEAPAPEPPAAAPPPVSVARPPRETSVVVRLTAAEALTGTSRLIALTAADLCPRCDGSGHRGRGKRRCRACGGTGAVDLERELRLWIPPSTVDGAELVVRGQGARQDRDAPPGDLFLRIKVEA